MSIETILSGQNADGGWPYVRGRSWTEPTVYAVLALLAAGETDPARHGLRWIRSAQRADGGWPPQVGVDQSTWVTALAALLPPESLGEARHARAIRWLLSGAGAESTLGYRLREWLLGNPRPSDGGCAGWPWFPGTAGWVGPTSIAILALEKASSRRPSPAIRQRVESGRRFLLARMCREGGWNYGSVRALGHDLSSYPETTGMALAALRGVRSAGVDRGLAAARQFLEECRSADARNWLRLGLLAHGKTGFICSPAIEPACRTLPETSMALLVGEAANGQDVFWG